MLYNWLFFCSLKKVIRFESYKLIYNTVNRSRNQFVNNNDNPLPTNLSINVLAELVQNSINMCM